MTTPKPRATFRRKRIVYEYAFAGHYVKSMRAMCRMDQATLAKKLDVARPYLSAIENNKQIPSLPLVLKLGTIFWQHAGNFIVHVDQMPRKNGRVELREVRTGKGKSK